MRRLPDPFQQTLLRSALAAASALALSWAGAARAQEFSGNLTFDGSPGVKFARCSERPTLKVAGTKWLTLLVRAQGHARKLVLVPEVDGTGLKGVPVSMNRSPLKSDKGKQLTIEATVDLELPDGAKEVRFRCLDSEDAFLGVKPGAKPAAGDLSLGDIPLPPLQISPPPAAPAPAASTVTAKKASLPADLPLDDLKPAEKVQVVVETKARAAALSGPDVLLPGAPPTSDGSQRRKLTFALRGGAQRSAETYTEPVASGMVSGEVSYSFIPRVPLRLAADWRKSTQGYLVGGLKANGQSAFSPAVDEQRTDVSLTGGYDLGAFITSNGRWMLQPAVGVRYLGVRNGTFPVDLFGPELGLRTRFALSDGLYVFGDGTVTINVMKKKGTLSAVGRPVSDISFSGGIGLPLPGALAAGHALELQYVGDVLPMAYDTRVSHGAALGVRSEF
jgi:hypothetical protein